MIFNFNKKYIFFVFSFLIPKISLAYVPLVSNSPISSAASSVNLEEFLKQIFNWGIGAAVALAILFIILGGVQYMTTDAIFAKEEGRKRIQAAVAGLLIALSSWLILFTINPKIFENSLGLSNLGNSNTTPVNVGGGDIGGGGTGGGNVPDYQGNEQFDLNGQPFNPKLTAYSPQRSGALIGMEGGYASSRPGLDGRSVVRTLDDYVAGRSSYITLAGDPSEYRNGYIIPTITYKNSLNQLITLNNVPGYVHDTGSAFRGAGNSKFDIPIGRDYGNYSMNTQPFNGTSVQFVRSTISGQ
jgi:hypothetical protein